MFVRSKAAVHLIARLSLTPTEVARLSIQKIATQRALDKIAVAERIQHLTNQPANNAYAIITVK